MVKLIYTVLLLIIFSSCAVVDLTGTSKNVREFRLKNGIKVIFKKNKTSEVVSLRVAFRGGVYYLNSENAGVESMVMNLSLKGTKSYSKEKINSMLYKYGIDINPLTQPDFSVYKVKALVKYFPIALDVTSDIVKNPLFEKKEFDLVKNRALAALKAEIDSPDSLADKLVKDYFFEGHPYYLRDIGRTETVSKINREKLKKHHRGMLDAGRMLIVVVGNFNYSFLKNKLEEHFGSIPDRNSSFKVIKNFKNEAGQKTIIKNKNNVVNTIVEGIFRAPDYTDPDVEPLLVALEILNRKLMLNVRTKRALVYTVYTGLSHRVTNYGILYFASRKPREAFRVISSTVNSMKKNLITEEELKSSVEIFVTSYWQSNETIASQGGNLAYFDLVAGSYRRFFKHMDRIFKVTPGDIQRVMKKYYKNLSFAIVGTTRSLRKTDFMIK